MKKRKHRFQDSALVEDAAFAQALAGGESERSSAERQAQRKTRQFCHQVCRTLNLALAGGGIAGVFIEEVTPAPDCGRLLVHVTADGQQVADVLALLRREAPRLRAEVAMAITRKRAPELYFVPAFGDGGADD